MATIIYLTKILEEMGLHIFLKPIDAFEFQLKVTPIFTKEDVDQVMKKNVSMSEFKEMIKKIYLKRRIIIAKESIDIFVKDVFSIIGINLAEDILSPYKTLIIKEFLYVQNLVYYKIFDIFCAELELAVLGSEYSLEYFMVFLSHQLMKCSYLLSNSETCSLDNKLLLRDLSTKIMIKKSLNPVPSKLIGSSYSRCK